MRVSRTCSSSTLPREMALPTTTISGVGLRFSTAKGCATAMPSAARKSDMGGYAAESEPVTRKPRSFSIPASEAMAVPQMPTRWMCFLSVMQERLTTKDTKVHEENLEVRNGLSLRVCHLQRHTRVAGFKAHVYANR